MITSCILISYSTIMGKIFPVHFGTHLAKDNKSLLHSVCRTLVRPYSVVERGLGWGGGGGEAHTSRTGTK